MNVLISQSVALNHVGENYGFSTFQNLIILDKNMVGHQLGRPLVAIIKPLLSGNMAKHFASCNISSKHFLNFFNSWHPRLIIRSRNPHRVASDLTRLITQALTYNPVVFLHQVQVNWPVKVGQHELHHPLQMCTVITSLTVIPSVALPSQIS